MFRDFCLCTKILTDNTCVCTSLVVKTVRCYSTKLYLGRKKASTDILDKKYALNIDKVKHYYLRPYNVKRLLKLCVNLNFKRKCAGKVHSVLNSLQKIV